MAVGEAGVVQFADRTGAHTMRAAAFFAASLVAIGLYLAAAAAFAFTPTWIGLGMLTIASVAAIGLVMTSGTSSVNSSSAELIG
jgi:uncharacterized RDD family membrane protein YckC